MKKILFATLLIASACTTKTPDVVTDSTSVRPDGTTLHDTIRHGKPDSTKF